MKDLRAIGLAGLYLVTSLAACGDGGGTRSGVLARLEAFDDGLALPADGIIGVSAGTLAPGEEGVVSELRFINTGNDDLEIDAIEIASQPAGAFRLAGDPEGGPAPEMPIVLAPQGALEGRRDLYLHLMHTGQPLGIGARATLRVRSNSVSGAGERQPEITYHVRLQSAAPKLQVVPSAVSFGTVQEGKSALASINLLNPGAATLRIERFTLGGHPDFELIIGTTRYPVSAGSAAGGVTLPLPLVVEPGVSSPISVRYTARDAAEARGEVVFFSNDPVALEGTAVALLANVGGPCITVNPRQLAFGGKVVGRPSEAEVEIASCGDTALTLTEIALTAGSASTFSLALGGLPGVDDDAGALGPEDPPVILTPGTKARVSVRYLPTAVSPRDDDGRPFYDTGALGIRSSAYQAESVVELAGFGVLEECPTAVIAVRQGEEVIPQTRLELVGSGSVPAHAPITAYRWQVDAPAGVASVFVPSAEVADPTFEVNAAGRYRFRLTVSDAAGVTSCVPAEYVVFVNPDASIHIELLWRTPGDPDPHDALGADLDLHFTHPRAVGDDRDGDGVPDGWFDVPFDCYWLNPNPDWGSPDPADPAGRDDDPALDRDDTDGLGPENLNLHAPEPGAVYTVGVHAWNDFGLGPSLAAVRVFVYANLVLEVSDVPLHMHEMWTVTSLAWPPETGPPPLTRVCAGTSRACTDASECEGGPCVLRIVPGYTPGPAR